MHLPTVNYRIGAHMRKAYFLGAPHLRPLMSKFLSEFLSNQAVETAPHSHCLSEVHKHAWPQKKKWLKLLTQLLLK